MNLKGTVYLVISLILWVFAASEISQLASSLFLYAQCVDWSYHFFNSRHYDWASLSGAPVLVPLLLVLALPVRKAAGPGILTKKRFVEAAVWRSQGSGGPKVPRISQRSSRVVRQAYPPLRADAHLLRLRSVIRLRLDAGRPFGWPFSGNRGCGSNSPLNGGMPVAIIFSAALT